MIYDKIDNIDTYSGLYEDIIVGLRFLREIRPDIQIGVYNLSPTVKAIVSEYTTKIENVNGYEAHRDYIDIQYLISGIERIGYMPLNHLKETKTYNKEEDIAFYRDESGASQYLLLGNGFFTILFPQDGHMPQLAVNAPMEVKKVVVKVRVQ